MAFFGQDRHRTASLRPNSNPFTAHVPEDVCRQALWRWGLRGQLPFVPPRVGGWWRATGEVGAVAVGQDEALLAECQWSRRPVGPNILRDLEPKAGIARRERTGRLVFLGLFSRGRFTPDLHAGSPRRDDLFLFDLATIA